MSDPKRQAKRATRAERRAAEEAAQQARAEQAAKERKQQTIIGCIVVAIIVVLVAIAGFAVYKAMRPSNTSSSSQQSNMTVDEAYSKLKKVSTQPANADDKAGFVISNKGYGQKAEGAPTVSIYMELGEPPARSNARQADERRPAQHRFALPQFPGQQELRQLLQPRVQRCHLHCRA